jgi:hypothetical protein
VLWDRTMQRFFLVVAGAGAVSVGCFLVLKSAVNAGMMLADLVLAATAATLVLATASVVFSAWAMMSSRQARAESARLARSVEAAFRGSAKVAGPISVNVGDSVTTAEERPTAMGVRRLPYPIQAEPASPIMALAAGQPAQQRGSAGRRH